MKLTKYGFKEWFGSGIIALLIIIPAIIIALKISPYIGYPIAAFAALVWFCIAAFFRDPCRKTPTAENLIISPADGVVKDIEDVTFDKDDVFEDNKSLRIGIFLSVLDVHLNRAPCVFTVESKTYKQGKFHDARNEKASKENESMLVSGTGHIGEFSFPLAVKQISGAIARRIVCPVTLNSILEKGERFGMIKFGSRTELFLPPSEHFKLKVKIGDRVYAGKTVIAEFKEID